MAVGRLRKKATHAPSRDQDSRRAGAAKVSDDEVIQRLSDQAAWDALPDELKAVLDGLPAFVDRRQAAQLISRYLFKVEHRSLEAWPLPVRRINGRAQISTPVVFKMAYEKVTGAPVILGGRRPRRLPHNDDAAAA
jgi:hypothetical protein